MAALLVLVINDHLLKGSGLLDPAITGKLSDFAGLLIAPMLLASILRLRTTTGLISCHLAVGAFFAAINLCPVAAAIGTKVFGLVGIPWRIWSDPADLIALSMLVLSWALFVPTATSHQIGSRPIKLIRNAAAIFGTIACLASSPWPASPPTVVHGRALVEHARAVFVVDASSGHVLKTLKSTGDRFAPAIFDNILYQVQPDGLITGIHVGNPNTPFAIWRPEQASDSIRILHVDAYRLYVLTEEGERRLHAIDHVYGKHIWSIPVEDRHLQMLNLSGDNLIFSDRKSVRSVNARTGEALWKFDADDQVGIPSVNDGVTYVVSLGGIVHGLEVGSGREVWRYDAGGDACSSPKLPVFASSSMIYACLNGETRAIGIADRKEHWVSGDKVVAVGEGVVITQPDSDDLAGLDAKSGRRLWTRQLDDSLWIPVVVQEGSAYVRSIDKLYAIDVQSGGLRWTVDMENYPHVVAAGQTSTLVLSNTGATM